MNENINKKEVIINAAKKLFEKYGYEKTTMDDIAAALRVRKGGLYYYFKNKEAIFHEVITLELESYTKAFFEAVNEVEGTEAKFRAFLTERINYLFKRETEHITIKDAYLSQYEIVEKQRDIYKKWETETIKSILQYGVENNEINVKQIDMLAESLFFIFKGVESMWIMNLNQTQIQEHVDLLIDVLFNGIKIY